MYVLISMRLMGEGASADLCVCPFQYFALGVLCLSRPDFSVLCGHQGDHQGLLRLSLWAPQPAQSLQAVVGPTLLPFAQGYLPCDAYHPVSANPVLCVLSRVSGDGLSGDHCSISRGATSPVSILDPRHSGSFSPPLATLLWFSSILLCTNGF